MLITTLSAGFAGAFLASPVLACTSEDAPVQLATLVSEARAIVVTSDVTQAGDGSLSVGHDRAFKAQDAPVRYDVPWPGTTCPYPWGLPTGGQQAVLLIADGPTGPMVTDIWIADRRGHLITPIHHHEVRRRLRTLDALLAYLLSGAPPDTSTADPGTGARPDVPPTVLIAILTGMVAGAWVARRPRRQIPRRQG